MVLAGEKSYCVFVNKNEKLGGRGGGGREGRGRECYKITLFQSKLSH